MAYFRRSKRSKPDGRCKKHPKHQQSPGVCSLCLREKLTQLSTSGSHRTSTTTASSSSSSLSSYYSSSSASSCSSPVHGGYLEEKGSISSLFSRRNRLTMSRSMVLVQSIKHREGIDKNKKKGDGFWSKLLHPRRRRNGEGLSYSRTVRETVVH